MSSTTGPRETRNETQTGASRTTPAPGPAGASTGGSAPESPLGTTHIADTVVSKIAGLAAREVHGVYGFGGGTARALGAVRERIPGAKASSSQGVTVEVGERQAAVDLIIVVEYGVGIAELARGIRRNVIGAVERITGLDVVEVNINVADVHVPSDHDSSGSRPDSSGQGGQAPTTRRVE